MGAVGTGAVIDGLLQSIHLFDGPPPPVLALHGFTGTGLDFEPLANELEHQMVCPDAIGHGGSDSPEVVAPYRMGAVVSRLAGMLNAMKLARLPVIGYSMGGRTAIHLALAAPERVSALILVGATPGFRSDEDRKQRRYSDALLASEILKDGVEMFSDRWERVPLLATQSRIHSRWREPMRARRRAQPGTGLANSLRGMGTGSMPSVWTELTGLRVPTLWITGEEDPKFSAIARDAIALMPDASHVVIRRAGHCAHLERPDEVAAQVWGFLRQTGEG